MLPFTHVVTRSHYLVRPVGPAAYARCQASEPSSEPLVPPNVNMHRHVSDPLLLPKLNRRAIVMLALVTGLPPSASFASDPPTLSATSSRKPSLRQLTEEEKEQIDRAFAATLPKPKAPVMLRLAFHDAGTYDAQTCSGGANASIRFELDRPENAGLKRGWNVIEATAQRLKGTDVGSIVSAADLIALAGAYAVKITGGPEIWPDIGRVDSQGPDPEGRLPLETFSAEEQRFAFAGKGLSVREMVALLGSHTLGGKGFGDPLTFDNTYYISLLQKPWEKRDDPMAKMIGLESDHVLPDDPVCRPAIEDYAGNQAAFYSDFGEAYLKLSSLGSIN